MTQEQREKLYRILGSIEGMILSIENKQICDGFCGVAEDLALLLEEDGKNDT